MRQLADLDHGLRRRRRPAEHCPQPREQLVDAERLRDVVVGARVERGDLLPLLADRREDDHRRLAPRAELPADVGAAPVREHEVEDHGLRRIAAAAAASAVSRGRGGLDLVARTAQRRSERPQDLRLVVDDEDPLPAHRASPAGTSTTGRASAKVAPWPGRDSAQIRAAVRLDEAPRDRQPEAGTGPRITVAPVERLEDPLELGPGSPGPWSTTRTIASFRVAVMRTCTTAAGRRELDRVLDQVGDRPLDLAAVDVDDRRLAADLDPIRRAEGVDGLADEVVEVPRLEFRRRLRRPPAGRGRVGRRPAGRGGRTPARSSRAARRGPMR